MDTQRKAGILMPISSLPAPYGIGTLGDGAYLFVDWLKAAGMKVWQVLPLLPTGYGDSPYQSCASNALNYYFIDFDLLWKDGLLDKADYSSLDWGANAQRVDYGKLFVQKVPVLKKAFSRFDRENEEWKNFLAKGEYADFALFMSLKVRFSYRSWKEWGEYRRFDEKKAAAFIAENKDEFEFWQFTQFLFLKQWKNLKEYAHANGVEIMGDMPIYVSADSVEMWKYGKELFLVDEDGNSSLVAGVPPDAFSDDGQLWGNPVYNWAKMKENGYRWWHKRIDDAFALFDILRIDHFRGFDRFYAIPADSESAKNGEWLDGPKYDLFRGFEDKKIIAEDLGLIDDGVRELMRQTGYFGMKVLEFAFDGNPANDYKPSRYTENCLAYTGTHDNEPLLSFVEKNLETRGRSFYEEVKGECDKADIAMSGDTPVELCKTLLSLLFSSRASLVLIPMQDALLLGEEARINHPSTFSPDNWSYRFNNKDLNIDKKSWSFSLSNRYNR